MVRGILNLGWAPSRNAGTHRLRRRLTDQVRVAQSSGSGARSSGRFREGCITKENWIVLRERGMHSARCRLSSTSAQDTLQVCHFAVQKRSHQRCEEVVDGIFGRPESPTKFIRWEPKVVQEGQPAQLPQGIVGRGLRLDCETVSANSLGGEMLSDG